MAVPYRMWVSFDKATLEGYYSGAGNTQADWTEVHRDICRMGGRNPLNDDKNYYWYSLFRPRANLGFEALPGMDEIVDVEFSTLLVLQSNDGTFITQYHMVSGFMDNSNAWLYRWVNGKYYDGENAWDSYPPAQHNAYVELTVLGTQIHSNATTYMYSYKTGGGNGVEANRYQDDFFRGGAHFLIDSYLPSFPTDGKRLVVNLEPQHMKVRFFNPVVNSLNRNWVPTVGGVEVIFTGLGFNNDNDELDGGGNSKPGGWDDLVDTIEFWKQSYAKRYFYKDEFDAPNIGDEWATDELDVNRTITQSGGILTVGVAVNTDARWVSSLNLAPKLYQDIPDGDTFDVIVKLNNFTLNNFMDVGIWLGYHGASQGGTEACRLMLRRYDGTDERLQVMTFNNGNSEWQGPDSGDLPIWLKIQVSAGVISFWWSTDGSAYTQITKSASPWNLSGVFEPGMEIGIHVSTDSATIHGGCQAPFEYFEVSSGSPYVTLSRADGDFIVDSNTQITIPANKFPALEAGNYILRLIKEGMDFSPRNSSVDVWSWAGDWKCTLGGLVSEAVRISIRAEDIPPKEAREQGSSIVLLEVEKKTIAGEVITKEYYSMDVVRCPDKVYEGIIEEISSFRRGLDDRTGLFQVADCTIKLSNYGKKFSKLLAEYFFKDQIATFYHIFTDERENAKREIIRMVVEDYNIKGLSFELILKDISQKYLKKKLPRRICTKSEPDDDDPDAPPKFADMHDNYIGDPMPEILGLAEYDGDENRGGVEAIYIDTFLYKYLAAAGFLKGIDKVYSNNILKTEGVDYEITYDDKYTYIDFLGGKDQGDNRITFDCRGYSYSGWDSDAGYVQNPAYIIAYVLIELLGVPENLINLGSVTTLAEKYEAMGEGTSGKLILQRQKTATEALRELLVSCGAKLWISKEGRFEMGRKDETSLATDLIIFEQFDLLNSPHTKMGLKKLVTVANVFWDYIPVHDVFKNSRIYSREDLRGRYDEDHEDDIRMKRDERK